MPLVHLGVLCALCGSSAAASAADLHAVHKDSKGGCAACHVAAPGAGEWQKAGHAACEPCHKEFGAKPLATGEALRSPLCVPCHPAAPAAQKGEGRVAITFSHSAHKEIGWACTKCHAGKDGAVAHSSPMYDCVLCHEEGGRRLSCTNCHEKAPRAGGTGQGLAALLPKEGVPGIEHGPGWGKGHAKVASTRRATCRECHDDRACTACHLGRARTLAYHPADWHAVHGIAAKKKTTECGQCHAAQAFCAGCHQRTGAAAYGGTAVAAKSRHPREWNAPVKTAGHHSFAAQRDITVCASCHDEQSCAGCHATKGKGGKGLDPHAAGFRNDCGTYLKRNESACLKCHQRSDLKLKCLPGVQILPPR